MFFVIILPLLILSVFFFRNTSLSHVQTRTPGSQDCKNPPASHQWDPLLGLDVVLEVFSSLRRRQRNVSLERLFERYGNTFRSRVWNATKIFTIEPKNLQAAFGTDFESWGVEPIRLFSFQPLSGKGIMTTDGSMWQRSRDIMKPTFSRVQLTNLSTYKVHVDRLLDLIPSKGAPVDLKPLFEMLALDSSTELLFGKSTASLISNTTINAQEFLQAYNYAQSGVGRRMQLLPLNILTWDRRFWNSCAKARAFVATCVQENVEKLTTALPPTKKPATSRLVLAEELLAKTRDVAEITDQLLNVFLPAHDATAVALTNIFFHLARHPEEYAQLCNEIKGNAPADSDHDWTFESLKNCRYLQNVMRETFRLNPSIGQMSRAALRDTTLPAGGGLDGRSPIFITKGTVLTTSFYALHRIPMFFGADARIWRPERWKDLKVEHWSYLPFGGGPRICLGQQLAVTEIAYTIVRIVERFPRIQNADPVFDFVEDWKITTVSANGAKMRLFKE